MKPLVSIIISFYNQSRFIRQTVQSALNQTYTNFEVVVRDDGSTDEGIRQLESLSNPKLRVLSGPNLGPSGSLNALLAEAKGELIAFLAGDDFFRPTKIDEQLKTDSYSKKFFYSAVDFMDEHSAPLAAPARMTHLFKEGPIDSTAFFRKLFFEGNFVQACTVIAPRDQILKFGGFRNSLLQLQDYSLWLNLASELTPSFCSKQLATYRILPGQANLGAPSSSSERRKVFEEYLILKDFLAKISSTSFEQLFKSELSNCNFLDIELRHSHVLFVHASPAAHLLGLEKMSHHLDSNQKSEIKISNLNEKILNQKIFLDQRILHPFEKKFAGLVESLREFRRTLEF